MNADRLKSLQIVPGEKQRPQRPMWIIFLGILLLTGAAAYFAWPRPEDQRRVKVTGVKPPTNATPTRAISSPEASTTKATTQSGDDLVLTVSGYIINRERISISPRYLGVVTWIGVKKGDAVTNGQVVVTLDDSEYKARLREAEGRLASAKANVNRAKLDYDRIIQLNRTQIESQKSEDDARLQLESAEAALKEI